MPRQNLDYDTVINAAVALADETGIHGLTLQELARRLDIKPPSLFNHVQGLAGVHKGITQVALQKMHAALSSGINQQTGVEGVRALAKAYRDFALKHPGLYQSTFTTDYRADPELAKSAQALVKVLMAVFEPCGLTKIDAVHRMRALRSMLHGFIDFERANGFQMNADPEESFNKMVELFAQTMNV